MAVGDVVKKSINPESVITIDCLYLSLDEVPSFVLIDLDFFVLMLKVGDHDHPQSLE